MQTPKPRKASGANVEEWQRGTEQLKLRLPADVATQLRARAAAEELTVSAYVARLVQLDSAVV